MVNADITGGVILSDQFSLAGKGGHGCLVETGYPHTEIEKGKTIQVVFSANATSNFWMLTQSQYHIWNDTIYGIYGNNGCEAVISVPAVLSSVSTNDYGASVRVNSTDTYYFVFDNPNQGALSGTITVTDLSTTAAGTSQSGLNIGGYQIPTNVLTGIISLLSGSGVVGWVFSTRKRRYVTAYLSRIDTTYNEFAVDREECKSRLKQMQADIIQQLKKGKIDETHFSILDGKITGYLNELG
jgi:hypothetical protein